MNSGVVRKLRLPREAGIAAVVVVAGVCMALRNPDFRTFVQWRVVLITLADLAVLAAGMTLVIATGGIDISVGSVAGLSGIVLGLLTASHHWSPIAGISFTLLVGAVCGLINGLLISWARFPPIIATLAMFSAARAGAYVLSDSQSISGLPNSITAVAYGTAGPLGLPGTVWIGIVALVGAAVTVKWTKFGRELLALGGSRVAARLSGIHIGRVETVAYVISGICGALAAIVITAAAATAVPDAGKYMELAAITAVILGGTPVSGGSATAAGTALGVLAIGIITAGVRQAGLQDITVQLVLGGALLAGVEADRFRIRAAERPQPAADKH